MNNQVEKQILRLISSKSSETIARLNPDKKGYSLYHDQTCIGSVGVRLIQNLMDKKIIKFEALNLQWNPTEAHEAKWPSVPLKLVLT